MSIHEGCVIDKRAGTKPAKIPPASPLEMFNVI